MAAAGPLALSMSYLREFLSKLSYVQNWVGGNEAAALAQVSVGPFRTEPGSVPYFWIITPDGGGLSYEPIGIATSAASGELWLVVHDTVGINENDGPGAMEVATTHVGELMREIELNKGMTLAAGVRMYPNAVGLVQEPRFLDRAQSGDNSALYEAWEAVIRIIWGNG